MKTLLTLIYLIRMGHKVTGFNITRKGIKVTTESPLIINLDAMGDEMSEYWETHYFTFTPRNSTYTINTSN